MIPEKENKSFWGFVELLESYYCDETRRKVTDHYLIRDPENLTLQKIRGFFAIKLSNSDMHILYGETVDSNGALTAKVLFDTNEIREVRRQFELYTNQNYKMGNRLKQMVGSNGFMDFLQSKGIKF